MSTLFKNKFKIDSTRLQTWDYSNPGWYYITICTKEHKCFFGDIKDAQLHYSAIGKQAELFWRNIPKHFPFIELDYFVFMPNHNHGILVLNDQCSSRDVALNLDNKESNVSTTAKTNRMSEISPKKYSLSSVIRSYKASVTKWCNKNGFSSFAWQPRFFDRIIRNENELYKIR